VVLPPSSIGPQADQCQDRCPISALGAMTLTGWSPLYRQDEAVERFCGARYFSQPAEPNPRYIAKWDQTFFRLYKDFFAIP
jgi:hypothetical protein